MDKYDVLKLDNQMCFLLYATSKELVRKYKPILDKFDLTYTQYITMLVLWEHKEITIKELGDKLFLDSGTLTPLVKKLEQKGLVSRCRCQDDERNLMVSITKKGEDLKKEVVNVPSTIGKCINLTEDEAICLYKVLNKMLKGWDDNEKQI